jgi:hypothetical protein
MGLPPRCTSRRLNECYRATRQVRVFDGDGKHNETTLVTLVVDFRN